MSGHRHSSQNTASSDEGIVFSNGIPVPEAPQQISLLHIPPEIVTRILLYLSPHDIISCGRTCRILHDLCSCPALRYLVQLERCAVSDDMRPGLGYLERLRILENREEAWATLDFRMSIEISVPFDSTGTYDFTGGALILGTRPSYTNHSEYTFGYSYISLPSISDSQDQQKLEWKGFSLERETLDFGLAVYEHDLIAALTVKEDVHHPSERNAILELRLLKFSTGQPHPLAEQPIVFIDRKILPLDEWSVEIEIVGDFLILFVSFLDWSRNQDIFFLVRWKTGVTHRLGSPEKGTYRHFSHLSQDTLVIPNLIQHTLEVTKIVIDGDDAARLVLLCVLHLPPLAENTSLYHYYCRSEPNPTCSGHISVPSPSDRPFRDKAEDAIVIFNMSYTHLPRTQGNWLTFIVHRRALLAHIPAAHRACTPFCSPSEPTSAVVRVPWSEWGPPATRLFIGNSTPMYWISTTAGQRAVMTELFLPSPIIVRDFNPYAVRAALALAAESGQPQQANWSKRLPDGDRMTLTVEDSVFTAGSIFKEDVRSSLPYVEIVTQNDYLYNGVMIDEERILGFRTSREDELVISFFDVHVLG